MTQLSLWKSRNGCPMERGQWRPRARAGGGRPHPWGGCCRCHSEAKPRMALAFRLQVRGEGQRGPTGTVATALWPTPVALQAASSLLRSPGRSAPPRAPAGTCPDPNDGVHGLTAVGPHGSSVPELTGQGSSPRVAASVLTHRPHDHGAGVPSVGVARSPSQGPLCLWKCFAHCCEELRGLTAV